MSTIPMIRTRTSFLLALALIAPCSARADVVISTLSNPDSAQFGVGNLPSDNYRLAQGFIPNATYRLTDVQVRIDGNSSTPSPALASLFDDNAGQPGNVLTTFDLTSAPSNLTTVTLVPASNLIDLTGGSLFWLVLEGSTPAYAWEATPAGLGNFTTTGDGVLGPNGFIVNGGPLSAFGTPQPFHFQVNGTALVPEPSTIAAIGFLGALVGVRLRRSFVGN